MTAPDLQAFLTGVDVLVYASGAGEILRHWPAGRQAIEFRYVPDPHAIEQTLIPAVERLRSQIAFQKERTHEDQ
jgi:hypothetical protein